MDLEMKYKDSLEICPFCESTKIIGPHRYQEPDYAEDYVWVECDTCGGTLSVFVDPDGPEKAFSELIWMWNNYFVLKTNLSYKLDALHDTLDAAMKEIAELKKEQ